MKNYKTNTKHDCLFYIVSTLEGHSKVLYDTMGGYTFLPIDKPYSEWENVLQFKSLEEAEAHIQLFISKKNKLLNTHNLSVMQIQKEITTNIVVYDPVLSNAEFNKTKRLTELNDFETMYSNLHDSWDMYAMMSRRNRNHTGYDHVGLQQAFKAWLTLQVKV